MSNIQQMAAEAIASINSMNSEEFKQMWLDCGGRVKIDDEFLDVADEAMATLHDDIDNVLSTLNKHEDIMYVVKGISPQTALPDNVGPVVSRTEFLVAYKTLLETQIVALHKLYDIAEKDGEELDPRLGGFWTWL